MFRVRRVKFFLKITAQEIPYTWLLKGNLRTSNFVENMNVCIWSLNVNCKDSLKSVLATAFFCGFLGPFLSTANE